LIRYAEFCTGIGGFQIGIEKSTLKAELIYCNELDDSCEKTYEANFGKKFDSKDIFNVDVKNLPEFDMICSGFPCQPFSQAGKNLGFKDHRGTIIIKLLEIIKEKTPSIVFLENVPNLARHEKGKTFNFIVNKLVECGYNPFYQILDSTYFGVPQSRPRLYIIGLKASVFENREFIFTTQLTPKTALREYLNPGDYSIPVSEKWQEYIDLYTNKKTAEKMTFTLPKTRVNLERISTNCDLNDCVFQIRSSGIRAYSIDEPFPTFAVSNSGGGAMIPVLSKERRHLSLIEMKRIMGFHQDLVFPVSRTDSIKQLANAVCPPVIASICDDLKKVIMGVFDC
jgi:DNA (cytosine-5)-methyltransferase 1